MALGKILSRAGENNSSALLGKQGVCIYKHSKPRFPALPETAVSACWGSTPSPLNSVSRWLRLCEPDRFLKKCRFHLRSSLRLYWQANLTVFKKSPPGAEGKSAGTVRSHRMEFCEKGVGGLCHQQAKQEVSAQAVISRFSHLWPQMPCLPSSASPTKKLI